MATPGSRVGSSWTPDPAAQLGSYMPAIAELLARSITQDQLVQRVETAIAENVTVVDGGDAASTFTATVDGGRA